MHLFFYYILPWHTLSVSDRHIINGQGAINVNNQSHRS